MYYSVVLGVLLYGAVGHPLARELKWFHHRCVHCIMGFGKAVQWAQHITSAQLAERFGMKESIGHLLGEGRL